MRISIGFVVVGPKNVNMFEGFFVALTNYVFFCGCIVFVACLVFGSFWGRGDLFFILSTFRHQYICPIGFIALGSTVYIYIYIPIGSIVFGTELINSSIGFVAFVSEM